MRSSFKPSAPTAATKPTSPRRQFTHPPTRLSSPCPIRTPPLCCKTRVGSASRKLTFRPCVPISLQGGSTRTRAFCTTPLHGHWLLTPSRMMDQPPSPESISSKCVRRRCRRLWRCQIFLERRACCLLPLPNSSLTSPMLRVNRPSRTTRRRRRLKTPHLRVWISLAPASVCFSFT